MKFKSRKEMHGKCNSCFGLPGGNEAARQQLGIEYTLLHRYCFLMIKLTDKRSREHEWIYAVCAAGKNKH